MPQDHSDSIADALSAMAAGGDHAKVTAASPGPNPAPTGTTIPSAAAPSKPHPRASGLLQGRVTQKQLDLKRTMIPILLTCGAMLILGGALAWFEVPRIVIGRGRWLPVVMSVGGSMLLVVAMINMLQVRDLLRRSHRHFPRSRGSFDA